MRHAIVFATLTLAACTTTGGFASKTKPVDWTVTLARTCTGLNGLDAVFKGIAPALLASHKLIQANIDTEAATVKVLNAFCDPAHPPTDLAGAVAAVALASVDMGDLVGALSK